MNVETPYAIERTLRQHLSREGSSALGWTLDQLLRSDRGRLMFWDASAVAERPDIERRWEDGAVERITIQVAAETSGLSACVGYAVEDGCRPEGTAWLLDRDDRIIDVAGTRRDALGFLGIELRPGEVARWVPTDPTQVAVSDLARARAA